MKNLFFMSSFKYILLSFSFLCFYSFFPRDLHVDSFAFLCLRHAPHKHALLYSWKEDKTLLGQSNSIINLKMYVNGFQIDQHFCKNICTRCDQKITVILNFFKTYRAIHFVVSKVCDWNSTFVKPSCETNFFIFFF